MRLNSNSIKNSLPILLFLAMGLLAYSNSFQVPFQFDDKGYIESYKDIHQLKDLYKVWLKDPTYQTRFIGFFTFALNYHFHQTDVFGYHLVNFFIHSLNSILVFYFVQVLIKAAHPQEKGDAENTAFACAVFFMVHPMQTQAVTYIVQRFASLAAMFYFLSLLSYLKGRLSVRKGRAVLWFSLCFLSAVLGMLTKEIAFTIPIMILAVEYYFFQLKALRQQAHRYIIVLFFSVLILFIPSVLLFDFPHTFKTMISQSADYETFTWFQYFLTQLRVVVLYLKLLFIPIGQNFDYHFTASKTLMEWRTSACFLFLFSLLIIAYRLRHAHKIISFSILWFFITLAVESSIIPIRNVIFEHRVYLPSFGIFLMLAWLLNKHLSAKRFTAVICIIACTLSYLTYKRNEIWRDEIVFWKDAVKKSPLKARPYYNLGNAYVMKGSYEDAVLQFNEVLRVKPDYAEAYNNRGYSYYYLNDFDPAIKDFSSAVLLNPVYTQAYINRANAWLAKKEYEKAIEDYSRAVALDPKNKEFLYSRCSGYFQWEKPDLALQDCHGVINIDPQDYKAHLLRAKIYVYINKQDLAFSDLNYVISVYPENESGYINRGNLYARLGDLDAAFSDYQTALSLNSKNPLIYLNQSSAYYLRGEYDLAVESLRKAEEFGLKVDRAMYDKLLRKKQGP